MCLRVEEDIRRDAGHLQFFREGKCVQNLQLQDVHPGLREDDRIQLDAFDDAIITEKDRDWLQETALDTWGHMGFDGGMQRICSNPGAGRCSSVSGEVDRLRDRIEEVRMVLIIRTIGFKVTST